MSCFVSRTCTEIADGEPQRDAAFRPLEEFRDVSAYVLLGDPGAGKTTAFKHECEALGAEVRFLSARDFLNFRPEDHPEWRGKMLFIDGLDEVRAGEPDARRPLDAVRSHLDRLGKPPFRLSCRAADWLGANDRSKLAAVAPEERLTVLRLDPLADSDVCELLEVHPGVDDSDAFIQEAEERGVDGFLANPQSLGMLADVVAEAGEWPASRSELFDRACRQMASECNEEHAIAAEAPSVESPSLEEVLEAAGRLCAVQLLAGSAGYALTGKQADDDHPHFEECGREWNACPGGANRRAWLRAALATRLFSAKSDGRVGPVHRHVAEFLGARYLARLIRGPKPGCGLPERRVLALMAGGDGLVVSPLRGLSAWLAAHCREARSDLVERDPIGVGLYGDVGEFSDDEKHALLRSLEGEASRLFSEPWSAAAFAPLATPAMEPAFQEILTGAGARKHPSFALFVLLILTHGSPLPGLASALLDVVRDDTWPPDVNLAALDAFIHNHPRGREKTIALEGLLADVRAGRVADAKDDLLGTLLNALYPGTLSPSDIWEYPPTRAQLHFGRYWQFWTLTLGDSCIPDHVADHLDGLVRSDDAARSLQRFISGDLPVKLLARGLERDGDTVEIGRLYDWLGVGRDPHPEAGDEPRRVRTWLERRPDTQKLIVAEGLRRAESDPRRLWARADKALERLHGSSLPADFGLWCLRRAEEFAPNRLIATWFLKRAFATVRDRRGDRGLSVDVLIQRAGSHPRLAEVFAQLSVCRLDDDDLLVQKRVSRAERERVEERRTWIAHVREHEDALRANRGHPRLLHQIAGAYFGRLPEVEGAEALERLGNLFLDDLFLAETAVTALRGVLRRNDVPDVDEITGLRQKDQEHWLSLPFLAGLAELDRTGADVSRHLDVKRKRIAVAFRYCSDSDGEPAWYGRLVDTDPAIVAKVMVRCSVAALKSRREHVAGLWALATSKNHAPVARLASLPILRSFPTRCTTAQLGHLNRLLWSALRHADRESLAELIDRKLSTTSMNVAQRVRWMAAAFVLSPEARAERVTAFIGQSERRIRELAAFLSEWSLGGAPDWIGPLGVTGWRGLVRLLGASFGPYVSPSGEAAWGLPAPWEASGHVGEMINRLAESPGSDAGAALEELAAEPSLGRWRRALEQARDQQRVIHRDAAYRPPELGPVCRTLSDGPPANAGDLAALVGDRLREIGIGIRTGNDNGWRPYWNEGPHRRPVEPKQEESCRDALLRDLRPRLPDGADAQPEGRYANDARADLRVACGDFHVPIEIKKHCHRQLWSAIREQLIARYASDPATGGYGIYLVLWFGEGATAESRTPLPPSGSRPAGPEALEARLEQLLTADERRRITVLVLDVSVPTPARAGRQEDTGRQQRDGMLPARATG